MSWIRRFPMSLVCVAVCASACVSTGDDLDVARDSLGRGDLLTTIVHLDRVSPTHPEYVEARSLARAVERRMRTGQRLFSRGLHLRAEWRDDEAIESFELARQVWPCIDGVDRMIEATRQRMLSLAPDTRPDPAELPDGAVATTQPVTETEVSEAESIHGPLPMAPLTSADPVETIGPPLPGEDGGESEVEFASVAGVAEPESAEAAPSAEETAKGNVANRRALERDLASAAADLADGRLDDALDALESLRIRHPGAREVSALLTRVLHQRALLLYGQGQLRAAIDAWTRILEVDPQHRQALEFCRAAETELRAIRAAPAR